MAALEISLFWTTIVFYAISTVLFVVSLVFDRPKWENIALWLVGVGFILHSGANLVRWILAGHAPYLGYYEVTLSTTWFAVLLYLGTQWRYPKIRAAGVAVMPVAFLMIAISVLASKEIIQLPPTYHTIWLSIHIGFNKLALGSFIVAAGSATLYLLKGKGEKRGNPRKFYAQLPSLEILDELSYRFNAIGFIFLSITILAGAIWAHHAWGSYWNWDPIETWSLIAWLIYALYLHLRLQRGWKGGKVSVVAFIAIMAVLLAVYGVPFITGSVHTLYLKGLGQ